MKLRYTFQLTKRLSWTLIALCISFEVSFISNTYANCKQNVVAVIDTGFGFNDKSKEAKLCKVGHKDFTSQKKFQTFSGVKTPVPLDTHGHGTNIVGIIEKYAKFGDTNYCILVLKYFNQNDSGYNNLNATIDAINYAIGLKADFINYSAGGEDPSEREKEAIEKFLNQGGHFISAAGNSGKNLDLPGNDYYPAKYDKRITVVGSLDEKGKKSESSNFGKVVNRWERGVSVEGYGLTMSGTSQATAIATGKIVSQNKNQCDIGK